MSLTVFAYAWLAAITLSGIAGQWYGDGWQDLWRYLAGYESKTGGQVLAIPHNGNLSNGLMFAEKTFTGRPIDRAYAETRMKWEPLESLRQSPV